ncbi:MAG: glucokinase [Acidobacteriota bacterium]
MILAADVGGTKTNIALFSEGCYEPLRQASYPSRGAPDLETIVREFLKGGSEVPTRACFGIAGPILDQRCVTSNLPWIVDGPKIAAEFGFGGLRLINDLEATAYGLSVLESSSLFTLNSGVPYPGHGALVAAGTGLGEAFLFWDGQTHRPGACEGGHTDFGPRNQEQIALLQYLYGRYDHVSYERILSGPGLHNIYEFLRDSGRADEPADFAAGLPKDDPSPAISEAALRGHPEICVCALDLFVQIYGAEAGNLALKVMATHGVYVAGGIAPKILEKLKDGTFLQAFRDKGRFRKLMDTFPVYVVLDDKTALKGAAHFAQSCN